MKPPESAQIAWLRGSAGAGAVGTDSALGTAMNRRTWPLLSCLFPVLLVASACSEESSTPEAAPAAEGAPVAPGPELFAAPEESLEVEWTPVEESDLFAVSRLIAVAHITALEPASHVATPWSNDLGRYLTVDEAGDDVSELPLTILTIEISDVLRADMARGGSIARRGSQARVVMLGGRRENGTVVSVNGQPIPEVGDEGVFFLANPLRPTGEQDLRGVYSLTGGGKGLVPIRSAAIQPASDSPFSDFTGLEAGTFVETVRARSAIGPAGMPYRPAELDSAFDNDAH